MEWEIVLNYVRSPHQDKSGYLRIINWIEQIEVINPQWFILLQIIQHQLYVATESYPKASQILMKIPAFHPGNVSPLIASGIRILKEICLAYFSYLSQNNLHSD